MRPSISKRGCPCPKPDPNSVSQNQTHLLVHALHRKTPAVKVFPAPTRRPRTCSTGTLPKPRGHRSRAEAVMESHPKLPPAMTSPPFCWQMGTGRLGVIYTPPAAQLSGRKEPRGREAPLPPSWCEHCSWAGGCGGSSSFCTRGCLIPMGLSPKKQDEHPVRAGQSRRARRMLCQAWQGRGAKCDAAPLSAHPKPGRFLEVPCPLPQRALPFFHLKEKNKKTQKTQPQTTNLPTAPRPRG